MVFKTKELEDLSKQILDRAMQKQQPFGGELSLASRIRGITLKRKLPRLPRRIKRL